LSSGRWQRNQLLCAKKHRVEDNAIHLLPADLLACVLFLKPSHQWFEVFHHRASGNVFAGRFLQDFAPIFWGAFFSGCYKAPALPPFETFAISRKRVSTPSY